MAAALTNNISSVTDLQEIAYKTDTEQVYELAKIHGLHVIFEDLKGESCDRFICIKVGEFTGVGTGQSKKQAKARAASAVLGQLKSLPLPEGTVIRNLEPKPDPVWMQGEDPTSFLSKVVQARRIKFPDYRLLDYAEVCCGWLFHMEVTLGDLTSFGIGPIKKQAKQKAAAEMLRLMGFVGPSAPL